MYLLVAGAEGEVKETISWIARRSFSRCRGLLIPERDKIACLVIKKKKMKKKKMKKKKMKKKMKKMWKKDKEANLFLFVSRCLTVPT